MNSIDVRDTNFNRLREHLLAGQRMDVYRAWIAHGPGSTRQIAQRSGIDLLNVRPRTTELLQAGALMEVDGSGWIMGGGLREGYYCVRSMSEWSRWHSDQVAASISGQQQLL